MSQSLTFPSALADFSGLGDDRVRQFDGDEIPREIQALGSPERIHRPHPLFATLVRGRYLFAVLLPAGLAGLYWIIYTELQRKGQLDQLFNLSSLGVFGGIFALVLGAALFVACLPAAKATVFFYRSAAVVAEGSQLTLIPWKHLLLARDRILTPEGHAFYCGWVEDHDRFEERIWELSAEHWLPEAQAQVGAGQTVTAGDLAVSATHVSYRGKTAAWDQVTRLILIVGKSYALNIFVNGSWFSWAEINLHNVPNARAMQQLITSVCPPHLLVPAE